MKGLDFGLAKIEEGRAGAEQLSNSPQIPGGRTNEGALLGTAAYMSPEQARGLAVDKATSGRSGACCTRC